MTEEHRLEQTRLVEGVGGTETFEHAITGPVQVYREAVKGRGKKTDPPVPVTMPESQAMPEEGKP